MDTIAAVQRYFEAWNRRDPSALVATFAEGGTYWDPVAGEVTGQAIGDYASSLFAGFPDLSFEITGPKLIADRTVSAQWVMRGTHNGPYRGVPPSGKPIMLPGADFITLDGNMVRSVKGYFDSRAVPEQLGMQVLVQPRTMGPVEFGYSVNLHQGKLTKPGAFSLNMLQVRSELERDEVRSYSRRMYGEMAKLPGLISALTAGVGPRMYTVTAWENIEDVRQIFNIGAHREAVDRMYNSDFTLGGMLSVWSPVRIKHLGSRCTACLRLSDYDQVAGKCPCGAALPAPAPYW